LYYSVGIRQSLGKDPLLIARGIRKIEMSLLHDLEVVIDRTGRGRRGWNIGEGKVGRLFYQLLGAAVSSLGPANICSSMCDPWIASVLLC
jgi:hypothetical protein